MLIPLTFAYRVDCVPRKGRNVRHMRFLDQMAIQVDEFASCDAQVAYRTPPEREAGGPVRPDLDETVTIDDRFFRVLRTRGGAREVGLRQWIDNLALDAGNHTLPEDDAQRVLPDPLGLRQIADLRQPSPEDEWRHPNRATDDDLHWPSARIEAVPLRRIVQNFHDHDALSVSRAATHLAIVDGRPFAESGEPVWMLRLIGLPDGRTQRIRLSITSYRETRRHFEEGRGASLVPFADYRLHRLDRVKDLIQEIQTLDQFCQPDGITEALTFAKRTPLEITPVARPSLDPTTQMLAHLALKTHTTATALSEGLEGGGLFATLSEALEGYERPRRGAHAVEIGACLRDLHARLTDRTVKQPPHGGLNRHLNAIPPALRRLEKDLAEGLIKAPVLDGADDEAIGAFL